MQRRRTSTLQRTASCPTAPPDRGDPEWSRGAPFSGSLSDGRPWRGRREGTCARGRALGLVRQCNRCRVHRPNAWAMRCRYGAPLDFDQGVLRGRRGGGVVARDLRRGQTRSNAPGGVLSGPNDGLRTAFSEGVGEIRVRPATLGSAPHRRASAPRPRRSRPVAAPRGRPVGPMAARRFCCARVCGATTP